MRIPKDRVPISPEEMLLEEFLKPLGMTQAEFAERIRGPLRPGERARKQQAARTHVVLDAGTPPKTLYRRKGALNLYLSVAARTICSRSSRRPREVSVRVEAQRSAKSATFLVARPALRAA
jgi:hypothetical protein